MIITQLPNTAAYIFGSGNAFKETYCSVPSISTLPNVEAQNDICICDYVTCEYVENVFAETGGEFWKNDGNDFLFKRIIAADTIDLYLYKEETKVADLNDNSYGTFFNGFPSGNDQQQLYVGYFLEWELVFNSFNAGEYTVRGDLSILGNDIPFKSRKFKLRGYTDEAAHKTVRIESTQNGNIIGSQFDYTGLDWKQSVRIPGTFGNPTPVYEEDRYITETRKIRQIKDTMSREWTLNTFMIPWEIVNTFVYDRLISNEILVTDYNILAESIWRRIGVFPSEVSKPELSGTPTKLYSIKFIDNTQIFLKRNF